MKHRININNIVPAILALIVLAGTLIGANTALANTPPVARISSPTDGTRAKSGSLVLFRGSANDLEDGKIPDKNMIWTSDQDDYIGKGKNVEARLTDGSHIIVLSVTDSSGAESRDTIFVTIGDVRKPLKKPDDDKKHPVANPTKKPAETPGTKKPIPLKPSPKAQKLWGLCYSPYRDNEDPDMGIIPTLEELTEDAALLPHMTTRIRTYGSFGTPGLVPGLCEKAGIDVWPGAWLGKYKTENEHEIQALIKIAKRNKRAKALIVGNEVLLRKDLTETELIAMIRRVRKETKETGIPVTTAEVWGWWLKHPDLAREVDFILVHIHPYWEGQTADKAHLYVAAVWLRMKKAFPGKRIVIGETGWPSAGKPVGKAVPSNENQALFAKNFMALAKRHGIEYFYFDVFDEKWKIKFEGESGAHWGMYNSNGTPKAHLAGLFPPGAEKGINRPPRKVSSVSIKAPTVVYIDDSPSNSFQPSGWMGDIKNVVMDKACTTKPHSGKTCIKITYKAGLFYGNGWSGVYWQYPLNNWGDYPGYRLSGAKKLTFWARGAKGGEMSEFKIGGIREYGKKFKDSFGPVSTGIVKLSPEWKKYSIAISDQDMNMVIGGFCWVTNHVQNRSGCTIYVDDIIIEGTMPVRVSIPAKPATHASVPGASWKRVVETPKGGGIMSMHSLPFPSQKKEVPVETSAPLLIPFTGIIAGYIIIDALINIPEDMKGEDK